MDWIKIRTGHILNTKMTKLEISALVLMQVMTAHFERIPTPEERRQEVSDDLLTRLQRRLDGMSTTLQEVLDEVLKDCQRVLEQKSKDKAKIQKWRKKHQNSEMIPVSATDKVDKEDKEAYQKRNDTVSQPSPESDQIPETGHIHNILGAMIQDLNKKGVEA